MTQNGEPSVEEILESIKKVIARDNRAGAAEVRRRRAGAVDPVAEGESPAPAAATPEHPAPHRVRDEEEVLDLADLECEDLPAEEPAEAPLITAAVQNAMQENLSALAMLAAPGARPQIVRSGETSLEGLVREMLRPMLAEWLDANLPALVERLVSAEIARIVGKRP